LYIQHVHLALSYNSNRSGVEKLAEGLRGEYKQAHANREAPLITFHQADLSDTEATLQLADSASAEHGRPVDILIANAGFGKRITDIE
jgi:3-oxoacyl-[acyl-carrier protein] reductase